MLPNQLPGPNLDRWALNGGLVSSGLQNGLNTDAIKTMTKVRVAGCIYSLQAVQVQPRRGVKRGRVQ